MQNENQKKPNAVQLIAWAQYTQEWNADSIAESLNDVFEAWLHTDFASDKAERGLMLFNINTIKKGLNLIMRLEPEDLEVAERLLKQAK